MKVKGMKDKNESLLYAKEYLDLFIEKSSTENTQMRSDFEIFGSSLYPRDDITGVISDR